MRVQSPVLENPSIQTLLEDLEVTFIPQPGDQVQAGIAPEEIAAQVRKMEELGNYMSRVGPPSRADALQLMGYINRLHGVLADMEQALFEAQSLVQGYRSMLDARSAFDEDANRIGVSRALARESRAQAFAECEAVRGARR